VAIVAVVALLIVGGAYGLNALVSQGSSTKPRTSSANAWLGLQMQSLANGTVVISSVVPGSPAASAGLKPGDVVTEIDSRPVVSPIDVTEAVAALQAGDRIQLRLVRGASTYTVRVKLTARPAQFP
jgi:S1-C subfamily serine protease